MKNEELAALSYCIVILHSSFLILHLVKKNPIDSKTPINSILREVSPNMLFSFLPLCIRTIRFHVRK